VFRCRALPLAAEGGQFDQRKNSKSEYRISNNEYRMSKEGILSILKRLSKATPPFDFLAADHVFSVIRHSKFCGLLFRLGEVS
jgi:hypothetical protein